VSLGDYIAELFVKISPSSFDSFSNEVNRGLENVSQSADRTGRDVGDKVGKGTSQLPGLFNQAGQSLESAFQGPIASVGAGLQSLGAVAAASLPLAILAGAAALFTLGERFDEAFDKIAVRSGEQGQALAGLQQSFEDVYSTVPAKMGDVADAIGLINSKLDLQGPGLEALATQILNLQRLTGEGLTPTIEGLARVTAGWNISNADAGALLDTLFVASREYGTTVGELLGPLEQYGAKLRFIGLSAEEAAGFIGSLQKSGQDVGAIIEGLVRAATGGGKDVVEATTDLEKAQEKYASVVESSEKRVSDARERQKELLETLPALREDGARRESDAADRVADAEERLTQARTDAAANNAEARRSATEAAEESAGRVTDAEARLTEVVVDQAARVSAAKAEQADSAERSAATIVAAEERLGEVVQRAGEQVVTARQRAADEAERAAERVADAEAALADVIERGAQRVADARTRQAEAAQRDADRIVDAERDLADAVEEAQERAADARRDAAEQAEDYAQRIADADRAVEEASQSAAERRYEARQRAADRVDAATDREEDAQRRLAEAQASGDPAKIAKAQADLAKAQENTAKVQQRAAYDVAKADRDAAAEVERAQRRATDARNASAAAAEAAARRVQQAEEAGAAAITTAQQALAGARNTAATNAVAAAGAVAQAEAAAARETEAAQQKLTATRAASVTAAQKAAADVTAAERQAARDIGTAQRSVVTARQGAAEAAETAQSKVEAAQRAEVRAVEDATRDIDRARGDQVRSAEAQQRRLEQVAESGRRSVAGAEEAKAAAIVTFGRVQADNAEAIAGRIAQANKVVSDAEKQAAIDTVAAKGVVFAATQALDTALGQTGTGAGIARQNVEDLITSIKNASTDQAALAIALDSGMRPAMAVTLVEAIRTGKLSLDSFRTDSLGPTTGSINALTRETEDGTDRMSRGWNRLLTNLQPIATGVFNFTGGIIDAILDIPRRVTSVPGLVAGALGGLPGVFASVLGGILIELVPGLGRITSAVSGWISDRWSSVWDGARDAPGEVLRFFQGLPRQIGNLVGPIGQAALNVGRSIVGGITTGIGSLVTSVLGAVGNLGGQLSAGLASLARQIGNVFIDILNGITTFINNLDIPIPQVRIPGTNIRVGGGAFGFPDIPPIPRLAKGGVAEDPMLAVIGDAGRGDPEVVSPESLMRRIVREEAGGGGGITFHIVLQNVVLDSAERVEQLGRSLVRNAERSSLAAGRRVLP